MVVTWDDLMPEPSSQTGTTVSGSETPQTPMPMSPLSVSCPSPLTSPTSQRGSVCGGFSLIPVLVPVTMVQNQSPESFTGYSNPAYRSSMGGAYGYSPLRPPGIFLQQTPSSASASSSSTAAPG